MTTDIERQFFETFGIDKKPVYSWSKLYNAFITGYDYPQITDRILLELIRIIGLVTIKYTNNQCEIFYADGAISYLGKDLKEALLNLLISKVSIFKQQVQSLFKEG